MKVLTLFSGAAGGWDLGMQRAGYEPYAACESDPWRRAALQRNFPDTKVYEDVRDVGAARLLRDFGFLPPVIVGSPPCQDASSANAKGRGVDGERTGLFFEAIRIVAECRPVWCCFENVPGLRARGVDRVLAGLEEAGYACWPLVVGAVHAGAPHRRNRVWIVAADLSRVGCGQGPSGRPDPGHSGEPEQALQDAGARPDAYGQGQHAVAEHGEVGGLAGNGGTPADANGGVEQDGRLVTTGRRKRGAEADAGAWAPPDAGGLALWQQPGRGGGGADGTGTAEPRADGPFDGWNGGPPGFGRVDDGLPRGVARAALAAYGDAVVPQITEAIGRAMRGLMPC